MRGGDAPAEIVLLRDGAEVARWPLPCDGPPDLGTVDRLARLQLAARGMGCTVALLRPGPDLTELLDLVGLTGLLGCDGEAP